MNDLLARSEYRKMNTLGLIDKFHQEMRRRLPNEYIGLIIFDHLVGLVVRSTPVTNNLSTEWNERQNRILKAFGDNIERAQGVSAAS